MTDPLAIDERGWNPRDYVGGGGVSGRSPQFIRALIAEHQVAAPKVRGRWYVNARSLDA